MSQRDDQSPRREELAAYFDGELSGPRRQQLEEWLADHPDGQADLEEWRQLAHEWKASRALEPGEPTWAGVLRHIAIATQPQPAHSTWRRTRWALTTTAALAASFLLAVLVHRPAGNLDEHEPLVLASAHDIEIISIDGADASAVLVGQSPLHEALVLADSGDINLEHVEPDHDGSMPSIRWWVGVEAPMIVATLSSDPER